MEQIDRIVFAHPELEAAELLFEVGSLDVFLPLPVEFLVVLKSPWLGTRQWHETVNEPAVSSPALSLASFWKSPGRKGVTGC